MTCSIECLHSYLFVELVILADDLVEREALVLTERAAGLDPHNIADSAGVLRHTEVASAYPNKTGLRH
jgi:hypothetical protein